jgi:hypothetical protein
LSSLAEKTKSSFYQFKHHTLEDIVGIVESNILSYGEGTEIIIELLSNRYPGVVNYNDVEEFLHNNSHDYKDQFYMTFDFGKALEKLV